MCLSRGRTDGQNRNLTPCSRVTLQKLTVAQLLTIYPTSYVNRRFVSTFKTAHQWPLPGALRRNPRSHVNFCKIHLDIIRPPAAKPSPQSSKQKFVSWFLSILTYRGADKSLARARRKQARNHVRDAREFNNIETRAVIKFFFLQGKAPKEIHAILTETLTSFLPGRDKELSVPLYCRCLKASPSCTYSGFKVCPTLLGSVGHRVPNRNFGVFTLFHAPFKHSKCTSSSCASAANAIS